MNRRTTTRQKMLKRIFRVRNALDGLPEQGGNGRLIALGDLNTMGRTRNGPREAISETDKTDALKRDALDNGMRVLSRSHSLTCRCAEGHLESDPD